ncbi:hypothetical protein [Pseudomonas sp.]|jgi:hypothetical protein|uniref:hypothetical protein n=1 Tax=Pseudomonas sp. TaxID=306 RepID=UPI0037C75743
MSPLDVIVLVYASLFLALVFTLCGGFHLKAGLIINWRGLWVGFHYSSFNKRLCMNLIPCVTIWVCGKGGNVPQKEYR